MNAEEVLELEYQKKEKAERISYASKKGIIIGLRLVHVISKVSDKRIGQEDTDEYHFPPTKLEQLDSRLKEEQKKLEAKLKDEEKNPEAKLKIKVNPEFGVFQRWTDNTKDFYVGKIVYNGFDNGLQPRKVIIYANQIGYNFVSVFDTSQFKNGFNKENEGIVALLKSGGIDNSIIPDITSKIKVYKLHDREDYKLRYPVYFLPK